MIFLVLKNAFLLHFADLGGQTATLNLKIIGKLLTVKGDVKAVAVCFFGLQHQIGHQLFAGGALGRDLDPLVERNGF